MRIGGFQKLSLIDYPGKLSAVIWTIGCNFRCRFCYNINLVLPEKIRGMKEIPIEYILRYLENRRSFLDGLVITGGEPTIQEDLPEFIRRVKRMNYLVKLDTNGSNPSMLKRLIDENLVDYVAIDIKTKLELKEYNKIVGGVLTPRLFENVKKSIRIVMDSDIDYEFRTTIAKELHSPEDILKICEEISGAKAYYIQNVKNPSLLIGGKKLTPFDEKEIERILAEARKIIKHVGFRQ